MNKIVIFLAGAAIGSVTAMLCVKNKYEKKYEQKYQEDVKSTKESFAFAKCTEAHKTVSEDDVSNDGVITSEVNELWDMVDRLGYGINAEKEEVNPPMRSKSPYVVSPEEFGEADGYDVVSLVYYADQVVADDQDELVEDVEGTIGFESLSHFGEYEEDTVFVRNERLRCDFEIIRDFEKYSDKVKTLPPRATLHGKK